MKISAVVLTRNEETNIKDCLKSLSFCDEVLLIDDYSSDHTLNIARKMGAKVIKRVLNGDFSAQRNFALTKAKYPWVLFTDADEIISVALADEIRNEIVKNLYNGYFIKRSDYIWGKEIKYGETGNIKLIRLAKKNKGKWKRSVHEKWIIEGKISKLKYPIIHHPHQSVSEFVKKVNEFSDLHAIANLKEGKKPSVFKILIMPILHFSRNYIYRLGFLDKTNGFVVAVLMSFHSFLAWSKLLLQKKGDY